MTAFGGFPPETIRIRREVHVNNRKDGFDVYRIGWDARCRGGERMPWLWRMAAAR
jgi:hypothetical protein